MDAISITESKVITLEFKTMKPKANSSAGRKALGRAAMRTIRGKHDPKAAAGIFFNNLVPREFAGFSLTFLAKSRSDEGKEKLIVLNFGVQPTYSDLVCGLTNNVIINFCDFDLKKLIPMGSSNMNGTELILAGINYHKREKYVNDSQTG